MFNWFRKKKRGEPIKIQVEPDELTKRYIAQQNQIAYINGLSENQVTKVSLHNKDIDFYNDELQAQMNEPNTHYIHKMYVPQLPHRPKKDISIKDILSGVIIGDIIGSRYEFTPHNYDLVEIEDIPHKRSFYTDDTVLAIATLKAIIENDAAPDYRQAYIEAYQEYPRAGYGATFVDWALNEIDNSQGYHSYGNGCAMRIAAIPAYYDGLSDVIRQITYSTMTTHNHVESIKNNTILGVCMWMALHNYSKEDIRQYADSALSYTDEQIKLLYCGSTQYNWNTPLHELPNNESRASLFVNYAVPFAIKCFLETEDYASCMREILRHYGDADTVCAIAGGLCVAYYGETGLDNQAILDKYHVPFIPTIPPKGKIREE